MEFLHLLKALKRNYKVNVTLPIVCLCECSEYLSILEKIKVHVNQSQWQLRFLGPTSGSKLNYTTIPSTFVM